MSSFSRLIRFQAADSDDIYFADLGAETIEPPVSGSRVKAYKTFDDLTRGSNSVNVTLGKLLVPLPFLGAPIYCVGLNYKTHAEEAKLSIPKNPPLWTKPVASLANPNEDIAMNSFCASSFPDYEGELTFVTSKTCRDISPSEAESFILGYTVGNDLSCRMYQMPDQMAGQFYFAKAFDKFAPIGPALISPEVFGKGEGMKLVTRVNGKVVQDSEFNKDMIFSPARILSWMSQGTTIPQGTAVMTGTPSGVGIFKNPRSVLRSGDVVEVEISKIGVLRNKITFS